MAATSNSTLQTPILKRTKSRPPAPARSRTTVLRSAEHSVFGRHKPAFGAPPCGFSAQSAEQQLQIGLFRTSYRKSRRTFSPQTSLPGELPKGFPRSLTPFHGVSAARFSSRLLGAISQSSGGPATESRRLTSSAALFFAPPQERPGTHPNPASLLASPQAPAGTTRA